MRKLSYVQSSETSTTKWNGNAHGHQEAILTTVMIVSLVLTALGAVGSGPVLLDLWRWFRWNGIVLRGQWKCTWVDEEGVEQSNVTTIKQRGPKVRLLAANEWGDTFVGRIEEGNLLKGTWRSTQKGVSNSGVFMLKIKGKQRPELEGCFVGLDDEGNKCVMWCGKLVRL